MKSKAEKPMFINKSLGKCLHSVVGGLGSKRGGVARTDKCPNQLEGYGRDGVLRAIKVKTRGTKGAQAGRETKTEAARESFRLLKVKSCLPTNISINC